MSASELLKDWRQRAEDSQYTHYRCVQYYESRNKLLGGIVTGLSALVATSIFASLQQNVDFAGSVAVRILVGMVSVSAAVLASLQTFSGFAERAEKHRTAGANYGSLQRKIQDVLEVPPQPNDSLRKEIQEKFDDLAKQSPAIPKGVWNKVHKEYDLKP
jgi:conflict system pore-forming effector with SLATT domain